MEEFQKILNNPNKKNILYFLHNLSKKYDETEDKDFFLHHLREIMLFFIFNYVTFYKEKLDERTNNYFFTTDDFWLLLCWYLLFLNNENFSTKMNEIVIKFQEELTKKARYSLPDKVVNDLANIAEEKFSLLTILENSKSSFFYFNIPYVNKYAESNFNMFSLESENVYLFELYGVNSSKFPLEGSFSYSLGQSLYFYILEEKPNLIKEFKDKFNLDDENIMEKFSEMFSIALLHFTKYDCMPFDIKIKESFARYFEDLTSKLHKERKVSRNRICPCGSGKKYKDCCEKKDMKWVNVDGNITRQLKINKKVKPLLESLITDFTNTFGRKPYKYEKLFQLAGLTDLNYSNLFSRLVHEDIDMEKEYAILKTGMFLTSFNCNQYTDIDLHEWNEAIEEFRKLNRKKLKSGKSIFEEVKESNLYLKSIDDYIVNIQSAINLYMNNIAEFNSDFSSIPVNNQKDFSIICSRKIIIDSNILFNSFNHESIEEVTNITRIIYEDLVQTEVFLSNTPLFDAKIKPLQLLENGTLEYKKNTEGKFSKHKLINMKTNEEYNISINIKELSLKSKYSKLYENIFDGLSSFIHLNISKRPRYFNIQNPLTDVQEYKIISLLALFLLNQCIYEIKSNIELNRLLIRDLEYIYFKNSKFIIKGIKKLMILDSNNEIYKFIIDTTRKSLKTIDPDNIIDLL